MIGPETAWNAWRQGFDAWERSTSELMEVWLRSPLVLGSAGAVLSSAMKTKVMTDKVSSKWWGSLGLPTKRDQERTLHALNELESRLLDLEERLIDGEKK